MWDEIASKSNNENYENIRVLDLEEYKDHDTTVPTLNEENEEKNQENQGTVTLSEENQEIEHQEESEEEIEGENHLSFQTPPEGENSPNEIQEPEVLGRRKRIRKVPAYLQNYALLTFAEAVSASDKDKWLEAIQDEKDSLEKNQTWILDVNLKPTKSDPCVFKNDEHDIILALYVDDGLIVGKDINKLRTILMKIESEFEIQF
ncbi:unnamed protein product [Arctia plantaginis]|uniref:Reverse transcriptase Ty1/copia-type domain-containing protein n=1 Tax=Arctia plantaginis TaxID=874455 RepID=A0A8S0ZI29_ARCPL|nr:unnamed protein product [Arctia plantaginis]